MIQRRRIRGPACALLGAAVLLASGFPTARANEPKGDLNLELRLVEVVSGPSSAGSPATGVARIEAVVDAYYAARDLDLTVVRADGTPWTVNGRPVAPKPSRWITPGGEPWEPGATGVTIPARGTLRALIEVPLEGAAVHEIIVKARGVAATGTVATEAMVKAALGVVPDLPVDDGETASFKLRGVR